MEMLIPDRTKNMATAYIPILAKKSVAGNGP
jgi:hypothetical protein